MLDSAQIFSPPSLSHLSSSMTLSRSSPLNWCCNTGTSSGIMSVSKASFHRGTHTFVRVGVLPKEVRPCEGKRFQPITPRITSCVNKGRENELIVMIHLYWDMFSCSSFFLRRYIDWLRWVDNIFFYLKQRVYWWTSDDIYINDKHII